MSPRRPSAFAELMRHRDYPMVVVTTVADTGERSGCLVGFSTQVSIRPGRFLVCISDENHTAQVALRASMAAVHLLGAGDTALAELFGGQTGDDVDKFEQCEWEPGPGGLPVLDGGAGWFAGRIVDRVDFGDHTGLVLEPVDGEPGDEPPDLSFQDVRGIEPGHRP